MIYVTGPHSRSTGNTIVPGQQATSQQAPGSNVKCVKVTATTDIPIPIANTMTISGNNGNLALQTTMSVQSGGSNVGRDRIKAGNLKKCFSPSFDLNSKLHNIFQFFFFLFCY